VADGQIIFEPRDDRLLAVRAIGIVDDAAFATYLEQLGRELGQRPRFGFLFISERDTTTTTAQRKLQAAWLREHFDELRARCWGAAFVLPNVMTRLILTSIMALQRLPYPHTVVSTREEGIAWLTKRERES